MYATTFRQAVRPARGLQRFRNLARHCALSARSIISRPPKSPCLRLHCRYVFDDQRGKFETIVRHRRIRWDDDVLDCVKGKKPPDHSLFHLSFDDGFQNVFMNALPILREHGVPAALFVPTTIISAPHDTVERYCRVTLNYSSLIEMATWDIENACAAGFEVGSHTRTQVRFSEYQHPEPRSKMKSWARKRDLERRLGGRAKEANQILNGLSRIPGNHAAARTRFFPLVTRKTRHSHSSHIIHLDTKRGEPPINQ